MFSPHIDSTRSRTETTTLVAFPCFSTTKCKITQFKLSYSYTWRERVEEQLFLSVGEFKWEMDWSVRYLCYLSSWLCLVSLIPVFPCQIFIFPQPLHSYTCIAGVYSVGLLQSLITPGCFFCCALALLVSSCLVWLFQEKNKLSSIMFLPTSCFVISPANPKLLKHLDPSCASSEDSCKQNCMF